MIKSKGGSIMKKHSRHIILSVAAVFPLVLAVVVSATVEDVTAKSYSDL